MNAPALLVSIILSATLFARAWSADEGKRPAYVNSVSDQIVLPMTFDPGGVPWKGESEFQGASWSKLNAGLEPKTHFMQARAGLGDHFPVESKDGTKLFEVVLRNGTNEQIELVIQSEEEERTIKVTRAKPTKFAVGGVQFEALFPKVNVSVQRGEKPSSNKATIVIRQHL